MTIEERVLEVLDAEEGSDRHDIAIATALTVTQVSSALVRLKRKQLVHGERWRETFVWFTYHGHNVFRDGRVHVLSEMCETCVFRPGNLMRLQSGRVRDMIDTARREESTIVCHATLYMPRSEHAACRGFFDRYPTQPLQVAERLGLIEFVSPPPKEHAG